jgi:hypothetical protein
MERSFSLILTVSAHLLLQHVPPVESSGNNRRVAGDLNCGRRFANFPCPVRTHHVSFVLNHLERAQLYRSTPFAESCAPSVHQIAFRKRAPTSPTTDYFRDSR